MPLEDLDLEFEDEDELKKKKAEAVHVDLDLEFGASPEKPAAVASPQPVLDVLPLVGVPVGADHGVSHERQ